jgi:HPt (histidine-containing phosphotransfer) domain-containing protein
MDERDELQQLIAKVRTGNTAAVKDIEQLAHKIYGSGSMFGFEAVSEQARELEIATREPVEAQMIEKLQRHADALEAQVQAALRARGVQ